MLRWDGHVDQNSSMFHFHGQESRKGNLRPHPTVGDILNQVIPIADMLTYKGIQKVAAKLLTVTTFPHI